MNILFVLPVLSDSYYQKRIEKMVFSGVKSTVLGFKRDHYKGKPWSVQTGSLGYLQHGKYVDRIGKLLKAIFKIRKNINNQDALYAFNLDILLICWLAGLFKSNRVHLIYDVADIRPFLVEDGFLPKFLRLIERFLIKQTSVIVVASPAYIDGYFRDVQHIDHNFIVIENKLDKRLVRHTLQTEQISTKKNHLTIGYFGMLRCKSSLKFLKQLSEKSDGEIRLLLRGVFLNTEHFETSYNDLQFVQYGGAFVYPDDLQMMYSNIDLVWAAHLHGTTNTNWSISNRFYQACYFNKPLITQSGTEDARRTNEYDIGCILDLNDFQSSVDMLKAIDNNQIERWQKNMSKVPEEVYTFTDEHEQLLKEIKKMDTL